MKSIHLKILLVFLSFSFHTQINAQDVKPILKDGLAQIVPEFSDSKSWIREELWVESEFDSDQDGELDRMHTFVTRPRQTNDGQLKLPVIYSSSPYYGLSLLQMMGAGNSTKHFWDVKHELGDVPPEHSHPKIKTRKKRPLIAMMEDKKWVPRGYIMVYSSSPGTGLSDGIPSIGGQNESLAPKAVIDWLCGRAKGYSSRNGNDEVKAFWSSAKVGMTGTSYDGTLALAAATTGVEGLEAIIPIAAVASFYNYYRSNGLVRSPGGYLGEDADILFDLVHATDGRKNKLNVRDNILVPGMDRLSGDFNDFWAERDYTRKLDSVKAAVLISHGLNDWNVMPEHSYMLYKALKKKDIPLQLYYHQQGHGGEPPMKMMNKWFTRFLHEVENGVEEDPKVWIVGSDDGVLKSFKDFPHPASEDVSLYLSPGNPRYGRLNVDEVEEEFIEKLIDDHVYEGEILAKKQSKHRLLYLTPSLKEDIHLSGTARVNIELASNKKAANLSVWLVSLPWEDGDGIDISDNIITRAWADPQNHSNIKGEPLLPGKFYSVSFDLNPDDQIVKKGQRIGLMIFSSDPEFTLWPKAGTELSVKLKNTFLSLPIVGGLETYQSATK